MHKNDIFRYVRRAILSSLSVTVVGMAKKLIKTEGCKLLLHAFQFVDISTRNRISNDRETFMLRSIEVKYNRLYYI